MTEEEWLASEDPDHLMNLFSANPSHRKFRLFAVACCRRLWSVAHICPQPTELKAVELSERFADGLESEESLDLTRHFLKGENKSIGASNSFRNLTRSVVKAGTLVVGKQAAHWARIITCQAAEGRLNDDNYQQRRDVAHSSAALCEGKAQAVLLRDIFGNPFRPVSFLPEWRTSTVLSLAQGIYSDRAFDRMPILADALQDSGCDNEDILNHCRGPGPHCRGCWVCDLCLNKS
jgi:hypothetical protein